MQASGSLSRENTNVHLSDGGARSLVARMERSEIRGQSYAVRESRIALRSIRATWPDPEIMEPPELPQNNSGCSAAITSPSLIVPPVITSA